MSRRLFMLGRWTAAGLAVVLSLLVIAFWLRSGVRRDRLAFGYTPTDTSWVATHRTGVLIKLQSGHDPTASFAASSYAGVINLAYHRTAASSAKRETRDDQIGDRPGFHFRSSDEVPKSLSQWNDRWWNTLGFRAQRSQWRIYADQDLSHRYSGRLWLLEDFYLIFPHWFALIALMIIPAVEVAAWFRGRRRRRLNLCSNCGYDLRTQYAMSAVAAATESNGRIRCPECGTSASLSASNQSP
jgi:hypothetical protein